MKMLSEYELNAKRQIEIWKNPATSWFDKTIDVVSWPLDRAMEAVQKTPVGPAIQKALEGTLGIINDVSQWSVRPEAIIEEYRQFPRAEIDALSDIYALDLQTVDRAIGWLDVKYKGIAFAQGSLTGGLSVLTPMAALAAIPGDVLALMTLTLRAVGEYATYCGFDVSSQEERLFALNVLAYASSPSDHSKQIALAHLVRVARDVALHKTWKDLEKHATVRAIQQLAKSLSIRLTKAKLAQILPGAGVLIGAGFNAHYTSKVCNAAFYLYRERFLAEKYGVDVIDTSVAPAETLEVEDEEDIPNNAR